MGGQAASVGVVERPGRRHHPPGPYLLRAEEARRRADASFKDQAPLGLSIMQLVMTLIAYPVVVLLTQTVFGVRKLAPGDIDPLGGRT